MPNGIYAQVVEETIQMERYHLGFDAGTQSVKVAVYDGNGGIVAQATNQTTIRYPGPRMVEMDADEYLQLTVKGMAECASDMVDRGLDPSGISSIFGDGIICGIVGVDGSGDPVTPYINYLDSRTQGDADRINSEHLSIWGEETGNADASCMFPAMLARWMLSHGYSGEVSKFVHNCPYISMHLAGLGVEDAFIDQGTLSGWGMGYDVMRKAWSDEQLDILGIDGDLLPGIRKPWDIIGGLSTEMAAATGIPEGTPICAGAGDTMQSMIGCGVTSPGKAVDVAGTCAMFCVSTDGIIPDLSSHGTGLIFNSSSLDDSYFYWGYIRTGGLALRWFRDNVSDEDFASMSAKAAEVPPGSNGLVFLPYLTGGVGDMYDASGCFLNMGLDTDRYSMWRSVLEAICYDYMGVTDMYRSVGLDLDGIMVTEGGSADDLWNQMKADALGSKVTVAETRGGAVLTDCIMGAYATGHIPDLNKGVENLAIPDRTFSPDSKNTELYRRCYGIRENGLKEGMRGVFSTLRSL